MSREPPRYDGIIERYRARLPIDADAKVISLGEGNTPLVRLKNIPRSLPHEVEMFVKCEGMNPTGSFKDRGMTVAVTHAVDMGTRAVVCASTGNTSASAAAYAARAGIAAFVLIPQGKIALGKLAQAMMHGAVVLQIKGNFDDGMEIVKQVSNSEQVALVNSVNPYRLQGQKTAAFEIVDALGRVPDYHCLPVGNAGNITGYWIGYSEYAGIKTTDACRFCAGECTFADTPVVSARPAMLGYQASGAAPFLRGAAVADPETVATAIRIGNPQSWEQAWAASRESGGWFDEFSDEEILATQRRLANEDGIFCEPASAVSVAGAIRDVESDRIPVGSTVVCTLTGHGLKDPDTAIKQSPTVITIDTALDQVEKAITDHLT